MENGPGISEQCRGTKYGRRFEVREGTTPDPMEATGDAEELGLILCLVSSHQIWNKWAPDDSCFMKNLFSDLLGNTR